MPYVTLAIAAAHRPGGLLAPRRAMLAGRFGPSLMLLEDHGSGRRRCPTCLIACNAVAAANLAPRSADGLPVPWDAAFIAARSAEAAQWIASGQVRGPARRDPAVASGRVSAANAGRAR